MRSRFAVGALTIGILLCGCDDETGNVPVDASPSDAFQGERVTSGPT
jgi:hypothetical protein